jgi:HK97 family phage portal protein
VDIRAALGAAVVKFLKLGRLSFGRGGGASGGALDLFSQRQKDFGKAYEVNVWAYRAINAIMTAAGQVPFKAVERTSSGALEDLKTEHPFIALLNNPNPFMTRQDLIEYLFMFAESSGEGYWLFDDQGANGRTGKLRLKDVKELWPIPSHEIKPTPDASKFISDFLFKPDGSKGETLSTEEVFRIVYPSPASLVVGQASLKAVQLDLAADLYAAEFERFIMKNLAANVVFMKTDGTFTEEQEEQYRRSLATVFKNVRIGFLQSGLDFANPQMAAKDLPFLELDVRRQKRISGALGVPPIMLGSEDAKYDNAEQQKRFFWGDTMRPKLNRVAEHLTKKLHALGENEKVRIVPDLSEVAELQPDHAARSTTAKTWVSMGYPLNAAIKTFGVKGMEEVEGGDVGLVSAGVIPIEDAANPPELDPAMDPEGTPEDAPPPKPGKKPKPPVEDEEEDGEKSMARSSAKAFDDARWKRFMRDTEPGTRKLRAEVKRFFSTQENSVLARLAEVMGSNEKMALARDARVALIVLDIEEETRKLSKRTSPLLKAIYAKLGKQAVEDVGASIAFNVESPLAAEFLTDHVFKFAYEVNKTSRARLTRLLTEKFTEGATQAELTDAIKAEFGFYERYRAARIARTESGIAGNAGIYDGLKQAGVEKKRWISARDQKVRETHAIADGDEVRIDEPFDVGGVLLDHPGDPSGPPEEIINCRCVLRAAREN